MKGVHHFHITEPWPGTDFEAGRAICSWKREKIALRRPQAHFLEGSRSLGCRFRRLFGFLLLFSPPAARSALEEMAVLQQAVEHGGDRGGVAQKFSQSSTGRFEVSSVLARW